MARDTYDELIFTLGDLAREHLADARQCSVQMQAVFDAEDDLVACREAVANAEEELNEEEHRWDAFLTEVAEEKAQQKAIVAKWRSAVVGVEGRSRDLKKKISSLMAGYRYRHASLKRADAAHQELELREGHDVRKIELSRANLKKSRIHLMREKRTIDELEQEFDAVLTPRPGQQGAQGILAHRRLLELEDELELEKENHRIRMNELEALISQREKETDEAEQVLDETLFALGEYCYSKRIAHPRLTPLYTRLDKT